MASPDKSDSPSRVCDKCNAEMTHLSDLRAFLGHAAVRVFRCYVCNNVVSEEPRFGSGDGHDKVRIPDSNRTSPHVSNEPTTYISSK
jgi:hypothetical protein